MATQGAVSPVVLVEGVDGERSVLEAVMDGEKEVVEALDEDYTIATHFVKVGPGSSSSDKNTVAPLYCGHLGDLVKCPVYSGTSLMWTPWGPGEVSCIERCPHFRGKFMLRKHIWGTAKCP